MKARLLVFAFLFISTAAISQPCNIQGTYTIGTGGSYNSLTAALSAIRTSGVGGHVVLELLPGYTSTGESFPINLGNIPCISDTRTITIRPQSGATNLSINGGTAGTLAFINAKYVKVDGRPGGAGNSQLTINGNGTTSGTIYFQTGAQYNTVQYVTVKGVGSATLGIVAFLASGTVGNSNNTISNCTITNASVATAVTGVSSLGAAGKKNSNNTIANCNITNYSTNGVLLKGNSAAWTVDGNSLYHSGGPGANFSTGIYVDDSTSGDFAVLNNFIGGSAPQCGGTRAFYRYKAAGIRMNASPLVKSSIQNNTISNIEYRNWFDFEYFAGIEINGGKIHCGNITGNTIGSTQAYGAIKVFSELYDDPEISGIRVGYDWQGSFSKLDTILVQNNKIGGIVARMYNSGDYIGSLLFGIKVDEQRNGYIDISGNLIGSPTVPMSMDASAGIHAEVTGIYSETNVLYNNFGYNAQNRIYNNQMINFQGYAFGIKIKGGAQQVYNNTIRNFYLDYGERGIVGMSVEFTGPGTLIKGNTIHSMIIRNGYSYGIHGISLYEAVGTRLESNFIHTFQRNATWGPSEYTGMHIEGTGIQVVNNMIRLGRDTLGNFPNAYGHSTVGIDVEQLDSTFISNNTVYLDGNQDGDTYCLVLRAGNNKPKWIINNLLVNNRPCTNPNYNWCNNSPIAVMPDVDTTGLTLDYNIYHTIAGTPHGMWKYQRYSSIAEWRNATKREQHSMFAPVSFVNTNGGAALVNLHLVNPTPTEGTGLAHPLVTEDFDGAQRSSLTPADIGADAGDFVLIDADIPVLTHGSFLGQRLGTAPAYEVKITDNGGGIDTTNGNKPRMWFRKKHPTTSNWFSDPGTLVSGNLFDGNWSFVPNLSATGLTFNPGDSLEYYFVAQDKWPFISYSNIPGANHTGVNSQVTPPTNPLRLLLYGTLPDTIRVGAGEMFTSLTSEGGFFQACRKNFFHDTTTQVVVYITSDLTETGVYELEPIRMNGPRIDIKTPTPVLKQVRQQNQVRNMITIRNTPNVHIDGSVNGSGRYLLFGISHTNPAWCYRGFGVFGKMYDLTINGCIFESNSSIDQISSVEINGHDIARKVRITNNLFREATNGVTGLPKYHLAAGGNGLTDSFIIKHNEFINFGKTGLGASHSNVADTQRRVFVDSNHFYYTTNVVQAGDRMAINLVTGANKLTITNNFIGGREKFCGGTRWTGSYNFTGIYIIASDIYGGSVIENNTIQNFHLNDFGNSFIGIHLKQGMLTVKDNIIGHPMLDSSIIARHAATGIYGLYSYTSAMPYNLIESNTVAGVVTNYFAGVNFEGAHGLIARNHIYRNTVQYIGGSMYGMKIWLDSGRIENNHVHGLRNNQTSGSFIIGIDAYHTSSVPGKLWIAGNRIHDLTGRQTVNTYVAGLRTDNGEYHIYNNQINLQDTSTNGMSYYGWYSQGFAGNTFQSTARYNTIRIGGSSAAAKPSYAAFLEGGSSVTVFRNNLLYNHRTTGLNKHLAIAMTSTSTNPVVWVGAGANNNLYITADTAMVADWKGSVTGIFNWRSNSGGDLASFSARSADVPAASLFMNAAEGDLNINTASPLSWYVNGKGIPQTGYDSDFDAPNVRSVSIGTGPTDIGSDEFNTSSQPPVLYVYGKHQPGGADTLSWNGRIVGIIKWGNSGTLPALGDLRWYSGVWPNDNTNNGATNYARYWSGYFDINATGGSGYTYDLTLFYDSSMLGKVQNVATMVINKKQHNVPGTWMTITPSAVNVGLKSISISNQTSFSEFTATDANATLPVHLLSFTAVPAGDDVQLRWELIPGSEESFIIQRSFNGTDFSPVTTVTASSLSVYTFTDKNVMKMAGGHTIYYRLEMIEKSGQHSFSKVEIVKPIIANGTVRVSQNPFSNSLAVQLKVPGATDMKIMLTDMNGHVIRQVYRRLGPGEHTIFIDGVSVLPAGVYNLKVQGGDAVTSIQVLKIN